jgi:hypothetical protein
MTQPLESLTFQLILLQQTTTNTNTIELIQSINSSLFELSKGYLWEAGQDPYVTLIKKTNIVKGSITIYEEQNDIWFMIYIIRELTKLYNKDIVAATVAHNIEGEILLVQAAELLPDWLEPETSSNRIFIRNGRLHIIPLEKLSVKECTLENAIRCLLQHDNNNNSTLANRNIELEAFLRLKEFPTKALQESSHVVQIHVSEVIAKTIAHVPELVPLAVNVLLVGNLDVAWNGDENNKSGMDVMVRFTRLSYARLVSFCDSEDPLVLGKALSEGFNQLAQESQAIEQAAWIKYRAVLEKKGYFSEDITSASDDNNKIKQVESRAKQKLRESYEPRTLLARRMRLIDVLLEKNVDVGSLLDSITTLRENDSNDWLYTKDFTSLQHELERVVGNNGSSTESNDYKNNIQLNADVFFNILGADTNNNNNNKAKDNLNSYFYEGDLE